MSTRVQQRTNQKLSGRELLGYSYLIEKGGIPDSAQEVVELGSSMGFPIYRADMEHGLKILKDWMALEIHYRKHGVLGDMNEKDHPALKTTIEGNWPSYTYGERLSGALEALSTTLELSPDSRRAYWPIFEQHDSLRAMAPTRVPCSLGYQAMIRNTTQGPQLILTYLQRSADFDTFFLTDIWLANQFQKALAERLEVASGQFMHFITSLHSFTVEGTEIY